MAASKSPAVVPAGRRILLPMAWLILGSLMACGGREPLPPGEVLELELGGDNPRVTDEQLRMALEREVGPDPEQARELPFPGGESPNLGEPAEAVASGAARMGVATEASSEAPAVPPPEEDDPLGEPTETPAQDPDPPAADPVPVRSVILAKGETLYSIAARELGDGNRWKEIAKRNGWSERQVSNLPEGTEVRLPPR